MEEDYYAIHRKKAADEVANLEVSHPARKSNKIDTETVELIDPATGETVFKTEFDKKSLTATVTGRYGHAEFGGNLDYGAISLHFFGRLFGGDGNLHYLFQKLEHPDKDSLQTIDDASLETEFREMFDDDLNGDDEERKELAKECLKALLNTDRNEDGTPDLDYYDQERMEKLDRDYWEWIGDIGVVPVYNVFVWKAAWRKVFKYVYPDEKINGEK